MTATAAPVGFMKPALHAARRRVAQWAMTAALVAPVGLVGTAAAQEPSGEVQPPAATPPASPPAAESPSINVAKLPIDLGRLQRRLRASAERMEQEGGNLKVFVDVYAFAPPLLIFAREDVLTGEPVPGSAPSHSDIIDLNTPTEHRGSNTVRKGGIVIFGGRKK